jgi:hypothetical protein
MRHAFAKKCWAFCKEHEKRLDSDAKEPAKRHSPHPAMVPDTGARNEDCRTTVLATLAHRSPIRRTSNRWSDLPAGPIFGNRLDWA